MLLHRELTEKLLGACYQVHFVLGPGFHERIYKKAVAIELEHLGIPYSRESRYPVPYRDRDCGRYDADFIVADKVVAEIKAVSGITEDFKSKLISYLKASKKEVGFVINFGTPKLQFVRRVMTHAPARSA